MKLELGDKVRIIQYWRRTPLPQDFVDYLKGNSDDYAGIGVKYSKYKKTSIEEVGIIVGKRQQKISTTLSWEFEEGIDYAGFGKGPDFEGVRQLDSEHIEIYLVATRMNCLRRVSFEDIQYIGGD